MSFIDELKRRNVVRVGIAYLIAAWLLIQISDVLTPIVPLPTWVPRLVFVIFAIGFVPALVLAWAYEFTPQGIKREEEMTESSVAVVLSSRQKTVWAVGVGLTALLAVLLTLNVGGMRGRLVYGSAPGLITSLAVLPLVNLSGDVAQEYFSDGMTETLITELSKIAALRVISRQSVMQFKDTNESMPEIARQLNVDAVVGGSALHVGDRVRITVQLIEGATDKHLWADSYDREISDVLALTSDVARSIAQEIQIAVTPEEEARLTDTRAVDPEAHRLYLLGKYHIHKFEPADLEKGIRYLEQAIELDPQYAEPHVALATYYGAIAFFGHLSPREAFDKARAEAELALDIDSNLASAHTEQALVYFYFDWDWEKAEDKFQRAISLDANYAYAHNFYAWFLAAMGRTEEAHASIQRALELDPLAILAYSTASDVFYFSRQYDQAMTQLQEALDLVPNSSFALLRLGKLYLLKGMFDEAIDELEQVVALSPGVAQHHVMLGYGYAVAGRTDEARRVLDHLHVLAKQRYVRPYGFALVHIGLGEHDEALAWLEKAYEERNGWMPFMQVDSRLDPLRSDSRFQDLVRRMNYPE